MLYEIQKINCSFVVLLYPMINKLLLSVVLLYSLLSNRWLVFGTGPGLNPIFHVTLAFPKALVVGTKHF